MAGRKILSAGSHMPTIYRSNNASYNYCSFVLVLRLREKFGEFMRVLSVGTRKLGVIFFRESWFITTARYRPIHINIYSRVVLTLGLLCLLIYLSLGYAWRVFAFVFCSCFIFFPPLRPDRGRLSRLLFFPLFLFFYLFFWM